MRPRSIFHFLLILGVLVAFLAIPEVALGATTYDDRGSSISFSGTWTFAGPSPSFYRAINDTTSFTNQAGASATLAYTGRTITYLYATANNRGSVKVIIDNELPIQFSQNTIEPRWQVARTWTKLTGPHTIKVQAVGDGYVDLDAFIVDITASAIETYDDPAGFFKYIGNVAGNTDTDWVHSTAFPSAALGTISYNNIAQDGFRATFFTNRFIYMFTRANNRGKAAITIDGVNKGYIDLYSASTQWQYAAVYNLGFGTHDINVSVSGQKNSSSNGIYVDLDYSTVMDDALAQIFARRYSQSPGFTGVQAYLTTPNPPLYTGQSGGPVVVSNFLSTFIESGPTKNCDLGCGLHPYATYSDGSGPQQITRTDFTLAPNGWYQYMSYFIGNNQWQAYFCDGIGCHLIVTANLGTSTGQPYVITGGENTWSAASWRIYKRLRNQ
jgi:hypothetical protein